MTNEANGLSILHVMAGAAEGGAENIFLESVLALAEAGVRQFVVTRANNAFRLDRLTKGGVGVRTASFNRYWPYPTRAVIREVVRQFRPDIAEYWMGRAGEFAYARKDQFRPVNVGWYGGYYKLSRFRDCDYHVALTEDIRQHTIKAGAPPERCAIIHTYAEFAAAPPAPRAALDTPEDAPVLLALARLHWKKGLDVALKALAEIPGAYLWIAGTGPLEAELKAQAETLGVAGRTRFLGWRNDRGALLAAADIVVFPSRYEPFGTVTVDAWAAGKALVAAASQGPKAYVEDGRNGLLVPIDDVPALRDAILRILREPDLKARLIAGGRATYEAKFTKAAFTRDSLAFYRRILEARK